MPSTLNVSCPEVERRALDIEIAGWELRPNGEQRSKGVHIFIRFFWVTARTAPRFIIRTWPSSAGKRFRSGQRDFSLSQTRF